MKTSVLQALLLTLAVAVVRAANTGFEWPPKPQKCAKGETWKECVGRSCAELTCEHPETSVGCTYDCTYGCYCAPDFFRNANKECVKKDKCP
ncbi:unnamed protein product [Ixodes pacificus]